MSAPPRVAETLAEILENRILLDWMAAAARRRAVRDFSLEAFVRATERIYDEASQLRAPRLRYKLMSAGVLVGAAVQNSATCLG